MDKLLIAEAAEEEYTDSLRWYAERSMRAAEGLRPSLGRRWKRLRNTLIGIPCATIGTRSSCPNGVRFKSSIVRHPTIDGWLSRWITPVGVQAIGETGRSGNRRRRSTGAAGGTFSQNWGFWVPRLP